MRLRPLFVYGAIVVVTLAAAEFGSRVWMWTAPNAESNAGDRLGNARYAFNFQGPGDLVAGQDGHWVTWWRRPYHVETNTQGFRTGEAPSAGARRIVTVGDSQTFGPYVGSEDTWSAWLQAELRRAPGTAPVQVFNGGVSGYTIADELAWLEDKGAAMKPDLIVLAPFENDIWDYRRVLAGNGTRISGTSAEGGPREWLARVRVALWQNSALYNVASAIKRSMEFAAAGVDLRRGEGDGALARPDPNAEFARYAEAYARDFRAFVAAARAAGIPLAVVSIPAYDTVVEGVAPTVAPLVARLCAELDVPFLDLAPVFTSVPDAGEALYLLQWNSGRDRLDGNGHLSRYGHLVAGKAIARFLAGRF
jgi:lysophospholipase L1-like esterase